MNLKIIATSTIQLFSEILRGVGRSRLDSTREKGCFKVYMMMDAFSAVTGFVRLTEAREHDQKFLYHLKLAPISWIVLIKKYTIYHQFLRSMTRSSCII